MTIEGLTEPSTLRRAALRSLALLGISAVLLLLLSPSPAQGEQTGLTGLKLTSDTPGAIVVTWDVPEQTPTDYRVNWAKSSEAFPSYTAGVGNGNKYPITNEETIEDLDEEVEYKVRVRARYRGDELAPGQDKPWATPWSDEKTVTVAKGEPPTKPRDLTGTVTHESVTLSWTEPRWGGDPTGYRIGRWQRGVHDPGDFQDLVADTDSTETTYVDTDVEAEKRYVYRVWALNDYGESGRSNSFAADLPPAPVTGTAPGAPTGLIGLAEGTDVLLVWEPAPGENISGYQVLRKEQGSKEFTVVIEDTGSTDPTYVDSAPQGNTEYIYKVKAVSQGVTGEASNETTVTTGNPPISLRSMHHGVELSTQTLTVDEGQSNTYEIQLAAVPTADVTVTVTIPASSNLTFDPDTTATGDETKDLTFTALDWDTAQEVELHATADANTITDEVTVTHTATSTDSNYDGIDIHDLEVTIHDSSYRIQVDSGDEEMSIREGRSTATTLCFSLSDAPTGDVTVTLTPDTGSDLIIYPAEFAIADTEEHCAGITAGPDPDADNDEVTITLTAAGDSYDDSPAETVEVTVTDLGSSPSPGIFVSRLTLEMDEGDERTYEIALRSEPTGTVTIRIVGDQEARPLRGTVRPATTDRTKTFDATNWYVPQEVTIESWEDPDTVNPEDDNRTDLLIQHEASGADYDGLKGPSIEVLINDNAWAEIYIYTKSLREEDAGTILMTIYWFFYSDFPPRRHHTVQQQVGQTIIPQEPGVTRQLFVPQASKGVRAIPVQMVAGIEGDYFSDLESSPRVDPEDYTYMGTGTRTYLAVTQDKIEIVEDRLTEPTEYFRFQVDDGTRDWSGIGNIEGELNTEPGDFNYGTRIIVRIRDNDPAGVIISETEIEVTEEDTTGTTYTVELLNQPQKDVTITITGAEGTDLTLSDTALTFTRNNWNVPQTVSVTARADDDTVDDVVILQHTPSGSGYTAEHAKSLKVNVKENDKGVNLSPPKLAVNEGDSQGSDYQVWLTDRPSGTVIVTITGQAGTDLTLDKTTLTFTRENWDIPQKVNVKAAADSDFLDDTETLTHTPSGADYASIAASILPVTVKDDGGVRVYPTQMDLREGDTDGGTYGVVLKKQPTGDVTITVSPTGKARTATTDLTFTTMNWNQEQKVKVTAPDDTDENPGSGTISHTASGGGYTGVPVDTVKVRTLEPALFQLVVSPDFLRVKEGQSTSYYVNLATKPVGDGEVTVTIASEDSSRASPSPTTLNFDTENWDIPQEVTVATTADTDMNLDLVTLTNTGSGGGYSGITQDIRVHLLEGDDTRGITATPTTRNVNEGATTTYTLVLDSEPTEDVLIVSLDLNKNPGFSVDKKNISFTTMNWDEPQEITITGLQDDDGDNEMGTIAHVAVGGGYEGARSDKVTVTVTDDDEPGVSITKATMDLDEGDSDTYEVVLDTRPSQDVIVTIVNSDDTSVATDETRLTFEPDEWNVPQEVTVTARNDADGDNDTVTLSHTVSGYGSVTTADSITVTTTDDDEAGVTVTPTELEITEGNSRTYGVVLHTRPAGNVTVTITETEDTDDSVSANKADLVFTKDNWNTRQDVRITAAQDADAEDGTATFEHTVSGYTVTGHDEITSAESVEIEVTDDEPEVVVSFESTHYSVNESDDTETTDVEEHKVAVTLRMDQDPNREVVINLVITNNDATSVTDYVALPTSVTFQAGDTEKEIIFTAKDDSLNDDNESVDIQINATLPTKVTRGDDYETNVLIQDDDGAGVKIEPGVLNVDEGFKSTYTVELTSQPTADVTLTIVPQDASLITLDKTTLEFDSMTWNVPQEVTATASEDLDAQRETTLIDHNGTSTDTDYSGGLRSLLVNILDLDTQLLPNCIASAERRDTLADWKHEFMVRLGVGSGENNVLRWRPLVFIGNISCYQVQEQQRDRHADEWSEWGAPFLDVGVLDSPPPGNWESVRIGRKPGCTDQKFRVRAVYPDGTVSDWNTAYWPHRCGQDWWDY